MTFVILEKLKVGFHATEREEFFPNSLSLKGRRCHCQILKMEIGYSAPVTQSPATAVTWLVVLPKNISDVLHVINNLPLEKIRVCYNF